MTLVVDSSVATKWVMPEDGSDRAVRLRDADREMIAPTLIHAEIGNAVWKRVLWKELQADEAASALMAAVAVFSRLAPMEELSVRALTIAGELAHPIYDCFYLALAERERCPLITADKRLLTATKKFKGAEIRAL